MHSLQSPSCEGLRPLRCLPRLADKQGGFIIRVGRSKAPSGILAAASGPEAAPASESSEQPKNTSKQEILNPLESWMDQEVGQLQHAEEDWAPEAPARPPAKHPFSNVLFVGALCGIAVGAFFLANKSRLYNKHRAADGKISAEIAVSARPLAAAPQSQPRFPPAVQQRQEDSEGPAPQEPQHSAVTDPLQHEAKAAAKSAAGVKSGESSKASSTSHEPGTLLVDPHVPPPSSPQQRQQGAAVEATAAKEEKPEAATAAAVAAEMTAGIVFELPPQQTEAARKDGTGSGHLSFSSTAAAGEEKGVVAASEPIKEKKNRQSHAEAAITEPVGPSSAGKAAAAAPEKIKIEKIPLRSPEADAALARMRQLQMRRQALYERAITRQEEREGATLANPPPPGQTAAGGAAAVSGNLSKQQQQQQQRQQQAVAREQIPLESSTAAAAAAAAATQTEENGRGGEFEEWMVEEVVRHAEERAAAGKESEAGSYAPLETIPEGASLAALKERATAANRAATAAAASSHRAAAATALAADAADAAARSARSAALAAVRCQAALESRSLDAIEAAVRVAREAEDVTSAASQRAAVESAQAVMAERDGRRAAQLAQKAADLSRPRGVLAEMQYNAVQGRRAVVTTAQTTASNVQARVSSVKSIVSSAAESALRRFDAGVAAVQGGAATAAEKAKAGWEASVNKSAAARDILVGWMKAGWSKAAAAVKGAGGGGGGGSGTAEA